MTYHTASEPVCNQQSGTIELLIEPKKKDLGGFSVARVLPSSRRRMVGPFIFFDHMGPATFAPGEGIQVRPHPHIGLATLTYLFEGEIMHRDSLGYQQVIQSGAVNLMTAGSGIVHSERASDDLNTTSRLHGIQSWLALPAAAEQCEPAFAHYPAADIPAVEVGAASARVILGTAYGASSPVETHSPSLYLELLMPRGSAVKLPSHCAESAVYLVSGEVSIGERRCGAGVMAVIRNGEHAQLQAAADSRVMVIGGEPLGERHIWWNFVASSRQLIEQAKSNWRQGRFAGVAGDDEFIPLPEH